MSLKYVAAWRKGNQIKIPLVRERIGVWLLNGNHQSLLGWKPLKPELLHKEAIFCGLYCFWLLAYLVNSTQLCCSEQAQRELWDGTYVGDGQWPSEDPIGRHSCQCTPARNTSYESHFSAMSWGKYLFSEINYETHNNQLMILNCPFKMK